MRNQSLRILSWVTLLASLFATSVAFAQSPTTGAIQGVARDDRGSALEAVTVVVTSPALQGTQTELTDGSGVYRIVNLPPGTYEVVFYFGEAQVRRRNITVSIGRVTTVNVAIAENAAGGEVIEMQEKAPTIDQGSAKQSLTIDTEYTRNIPIPGRSYNSALGAAAGAQGDDNGTGFSGSQSGENVYVIDGVNTTGLVFGQSASPVLNNFIQEIEIITGGYEAEFGRSTGGVVNVATKTGSNEFRGQVFSYVTPFQLDADEVPFAGSALTSRTKLSYNMDFGFDLGGPIVKDKVWFYVGFAPSFSKNKRRRIVRTRVDRRVNNFDYGADADSDDDPMTTVAVGCENNDSCESDGLPDVDPNTGFEVFEEVGHRNQTLTTTGYMFLTKINFAVSPDHQGVFSVIGSPSSSQSPFTSFGTPSSTEQDVTGLTTDVSFKWASKFNNNKTQLDAVFGWHRDKFDNNPANDVNGMGLATADTPATSVAFHPDGDRVIDLGVIGRNPDVREDADTLAFCTDQNGLTGMSGVRDPFPGIQNCPIGSYVYNGYSGVFDRLEQRFSAKATATQRVKALGFHEIKGGLDVENNRLDNTRQLSGGVGYNSFANWESYRYVRLDPNGADVCGQTDTDGDGTPEDVKCNYLDQIDSTGQTLNWSAFVQDKWQIIPNFTVSAGVRYEQQIMRNAKEIQDQLFDKFSGAICDSALSAEDQERFCSPAGATGMNLKHMVAPRLGMLYDWTKEGRSKVYGHWGRFYESVPMSLNDRAFGGETQYETDWDWNTQCGEAYTDPENPGLQVLPSQGEGCPTRPFADANSIPDADRVLGGTTIAAPGLKAQFLDEYILGVEYEVLEDLALGIAYQNRQLGRVVEDVSTDGGATYIIANPGQFDEGEENKLEDQIAGESDPALKEALETRLTNLRQVRRFDDAKRDYNAVTFTARKRFSQSFFAQGSYTWSRTEGNYPGLYNPDTGQNNPNISSQYDLFELLANRDGRLNSDRPHNFKLDGYYIFDMKKAGAVTTGLSFRAISGAPISALGRHPVYGRLESYVLPRGAFGREAFLTTTAIHLAYKRKLGKSMGLEVFFDVFNLFNQQNESSADSEYSLDRVNPIVGGSQEDLKYLKAMNTRAEETNAVARRRLSHNSTTSLQAPLSGRLGFILTF